MPQVDNLEDDLASFSQQYKELKAQLSQLEAELVAKGELVDDLQTRTDAAIQREHEAVVSCSFFIVFYLRLAVRGKRLLINGFIFARNETMHKGYTLRTKE